jgi:hypothetical protein
MRIGQNLPAQSFDSIGSLLARATRLFFATLPFLTAVTVAVLLPSKLALQLFCYAFDISPDGVAGYLLIDGGDFVFTALVAPAVVYGLLDYLRTGKTPSTGAALGQARRIWGRSLWNRFKAEVTITLWSALLLIPGIVAMVRLIFVDPIVVIEEREPEVLRRSRALAKGHGWRIFLTILPALPIGIAHLYATFRSLQISRWLMVPVDTLFSVADLWLAIVVLLMYLGVASATEPQGRIHV